MASQSKTGRNDRCPCGSGKKHKNCCLGVAETVSTSRRMGLSIGIVVVGFAAAAFLWTRKGGDFALSALAASVIVSAAVYVFRDPNPPRGGSGSDSSSINFGA